MSVVFCCSLILLFLFCFFSKSGCGKIFFFDFLVVVGFICKSKRIHSCFQKYVFLFLLFLLFLVFNFSLFSLFSTVSEMSSAANLNNRDASGWAKLHHAAARGDVPEVKRLVTEGADCNCCTSGGIAGKTALHLASADGHFDVVRFLVDNGSDIDAQTKFGYGDVCWFFCMYVSLPLS